MKGDETEVRIHRAARTTVLYQFSDIRVYVVQGRRGQPYLVLDAIKSIQQLLELRIVCTNLSGK